MVTKTSATSDSTASAASASAASAVSAASATSAASANRRRGLAGIAGASALVLGALAVTGCGSGTSKNAGDAVSKASSAISSAASQAGGAVSSAASSASSAISQIKGGVDAKADVSVGNVTFASDGKAEVQLNVTNPTADDHDYTISITFDDPNGNLLDATVVTVSQVPGNGSKDATARSNRDLSGTLTAKVTAAVRH